MLGNRKWHELIPISWPRKDLKLIGEKIPPLSSKSPPSQFVLFCGLSGEVVFIEIKNLA